MSPPNCVGAAMRFTWPRLTGLTRTVDSPSTTTASVSSSATSTFTPSRRVPLREPASVRRHAWPSRAMRQWKREMVLSSRTRSFEACDPMRHTSPSKRWVIATSLPAILSTTTCRRTSSTAGPLSATRGFTCFASVTLASPKSSLRGMASSLPHAEDDAASASTLTCTTSRVAWRKSTTTIPEILVKSHENRGGPRLAPALPEQHVVAPLT